MGSRGSRNRGNDRGNDIDIDQVRTEQAAFLDQIDQFRLQQQFLEEQRQRLIDQQEFDFQGLISALDALTQQQQEGFEGQLTQSEVFLNDLAGRNQQLQSVLQGQAQTQQNVAGQQQQDIQGSGDFLSQLLQNVRGQTGQATTQSNQRSQAQANQATRGEDFRLSRQQQLSNLALGAEQRLNRDRQNLLSRTVQDERKSRERREGARANLRGQPATSGQVQGNRPLTQDSARLNQVRRDRGQQIQQRRQRAGEPGFLSGSQRSLTPQELEEIRRELQQGRTGFVGPISGRRNNRSRRVL